MRSVVVPVLVVCASAVLILALIIHVGSASSKQPGVASQPKSSLNVGSQAPVGPRAEDVTIHPFELLKNPFLQKNHLVRLDVHSYPILLDGNLLQYNEYSGVPNIVSRELVGVRFEKMLDEKTALYEVLGYNRVGLMSNGGTEEGMARLGELAVLVASGTGQLNSEELWSVEPLGTLEGTNAFGAAISIPFVRFDGYWRLQQPVPHETTGDAKTAVDLVKTHIRPTAYLMSLQPSFDKSDWQPIDDEEFFGAGSWGVCYHVRILNSGSPSVGFVNPCWDVNLKAKTVKIQQKYRVDIPVPDDGSTSRYFETSN